MKASRATDAERITRVIFHYAALIAREQNPERLLVLNAAMARDLVGAERCSIWLLEAERGELRTRMADGIEDVRIPSDQGLVGACLRDGQPIMVNDAASDSRFYTGVDKISGYQTLSLLSVPLRSADGSIIGVFQALNKPGGFLDSDAELLSLASSYSAAVIEGQGLRRQAEVARLLRRELELAREVQQQMFPTDIPTVPGFDCSARCRPATFVGGDYYDLFLLPGGNLAITLGDVSGKGIAAALVMAQLQFALRGRLAQPSSPLSETIADFSTAVHRSTAPDRYSTLFCGILDTRTKKLTYVTCGHIPPVLYHTCHGQVRSDRLGIGGPPVGLLRGWPFEEATVQLVPGDTLVCFSDGVSEATDVRDEMWGEDSVIGAVAEALHEDAKQIVGHLFGAADAFTLGAEQYDDMTAVVIRSV